VKKHSRATLACVPLCADASRFYSTESRRYQFPVADLAEWHQRSLDAIREPLEPDQTSASSLWHLLHSSSPGDRNSLQWEPIVEEFITQNHILQIPHTFSSPNLAPSNFWLFDHMKIYLVGQMFDESHQLLDGITNFLEAIRPLEL
jgi:hypothetical protein